MELLLPTMLAGIALIVVGIYLIVFWWGYWKVSYKGKLLTGGPYALVRHPYYLGFLLLVTGLVVIAPLIETAGLAILSWTVIITHTKGEEEELIKKYGKQYKEYMERVRWRLIPGVY